MALTLPDLGDITPTPTVCLSVEFLATTLRFTLNPEQVEAWSDADLTSKIAALKAGVLPLLPSNMTGMSAYVEWDAYASVITNQS